METEPKKADEQRVGISTLAYLFLQVFLDGKIYEASVVDELCWVVKELASQEPDACLLQELKQGLRYGHYVENSRDAIFAFAMQRMVELYQLPRQTAKSACVCLQNLLNEAQKTFNVRK